MAFLDRVNLPIGTDTRKSDALRLQIPPQPVTARTASVAAAAAGVALPDAANDLRLQPAPAIRRAEGTGLLSPRLMKSGYLPRHPRLDALFNRALAAFFLLLTAPVFLAICAMLRIGGGGPMFYSGARLGRNGQLFNILKFRTLAVNAQAQLTGGTLPKRSNLETGVGSYLRKSRLDELPQLINILKGDMVFFGPRPVRPEMVPVYKAESDSFEQRFLVRPGLVGLSQALLPHSASKRLRGRFNAMCCAAPVRYGFLLRFVLATGFNVARRGVAAAAEALRAARSPVGRHTFLRSGFARARNVALELEAPGGQLTGAVLAMSDETLQFVATRPAPAGPCRVTLLRKLGSGRVARLVLEARVETVMPVGLGQSGFVGYATFDEPSAYQRYRLERYFLDQTVLPT